MNTSFKISNTGLQVWVEAHFHFHFTGNLSGCTTLLPDRKTPNPASGPLLGTTVLPSFPRKIFLSCSYGSLQEISAAWTAASSEHTTSAFVTAVEV